MSNDEFKLKLPLFESLLECGKLMQQREDAIARIHASNKAIDAANAEHRAAAKAFHALEARCVAAGAAVTAQYAIFYPFNFDEGDQSTLGF